MTFRAIFALFALLLAGCVSISRQPVARLNQIQVIGSHNSYRQMPHPSVFEVIKRKSASGAASLEYQHPPLADQFEAGIRQIELDIFADPEGGRFANPTGPADAARAGLGNVPTHDPAGKLKQPGYKVLHIPNTDYFTSVLTLKDALSSVREWSRANPSHVPIFILLELKSYAPSGGKGAPYTTTDLRALEEEILAVFSPDHILKPDDVRRGESTLPHALKEHGWPRVNDVRGKVMFALDNEDATRETYLEGATNLKNRLLFVSVAPDHPAAAWMKMNDVIKDFDEIQQLVRDGFLVRTRSDVGTTEARANDPRRRDLAMTSGAQFISTDYWEPNLKFSPYRVEFEGGAVARANVLNTPAEWRSHDFEQLK